MYRNLSDRPVQANEAGGAPHQDERAVVVSQADAKVNELSLSTDELHRVIDEQNRMLHFLLRANMSQYQQHSRTQAERLSACREHVIALEKQVHDLKAQKAACMTQQAELARFVQIQDQTLCELESHYKELLHGMKQLQKIQRTVRAALSRMDELKKTMLRFPHQAEVEGAQKDILTLQENHAMLLAMGKPLLELDMQVAAMKSRLQSHGTQLRKAIQARLTSAEISAVEATLSCVQKGFFEAVSKRREANSQRCQALAQQIDRVVAELQTLEARRITGNYTLAQTFNNHTHGQSNILHAPQDTLQNDVVDGATLTLASATDRPHTPLTFRN